MMATCVELYGFRESYYFKIEVVIGIEFVLPYRVEAPITNQLRDFVPYLERYKVVQNPPM
jgi:hypothetical protein